MTEGKENGVTSYRAAPQSELLEALAARCEREEPSRNLNVEIAGAMGWWVEGGRLIIQRSHDKKIVRYGEPRAYTTSLDAAVTLVPSGMHMDLHDWTWAEEPCWCGAIQTAQRHLVHATVAGRKAKTGPLALCAAALRARAALALAEGNAPEVAGPSTERGEANTLINKGE